MPPRSFPTALPAGILPSTIGEVPEIAFDPVPRKRRRHDGWTEARQRGFIAALADCGSVSAAARHVGMTARSAYRLLGQDGSADFARAWDRAIDLGIERTRCDALHRALHGALVPIYRRGKLVKVELRRSDRLAIGLLSGHRGPAAPRLVAEDRASHCADLKAYDAAAPGLARKAALDAAIDRIRQVADRRWREEQLLAELSDRPPEE